MNKCIVSGKTGYHSGCDLWEDGAAFVFSERAGTTRGSITVDGTPSDIRCCVTSPFLRREREYFIDSLLVRI